MEENQKKEPRSQQIKTFFTTTAVGFLMGIGMIAPGVSGGAIAVIFGLYEQITDAVAHFYREFRKKMAFLIPLAIGAGVSVLLFSQIIQFFFTEYNAPTRCLFLGLMIGTLPSVFRTAAKDGFRVRYLPLFVVMAALAILMGMPGNFSYTGGQEGLTFPLLLISGAVIGFGTIVPGVSSSFLLMAAGLYDPLLTVLNTRDIPRLLPIALGFGIFVLLFTRLVNWLYQKAYGFTSFAVCGLLVGSLFPVIPPLKADLASAAAVLLGVAGAVLSWYLLRRKEKGLTAKEPDPHTNEESAPPPDRS